MLISIRIILANINLDENKNLHSLRRANLLEITVIMSCTVCLLLRCNESVMLSMSRASRSFRANIGAQTRHKTCKPVAWNLQCVQFLSANLLLITYPFLIKRNGSFCFDVLIKISFPTRSRRSVADSVVSRLLFIKIGHLFRWVTSHWDQSAQM